MENRAIIDLRILRKNAQSVRNFLPKETKFCAVVKADGYGHGMCEVANAIYDLVDCYAVTSVFEGEQLRLSGINKDVLVLSPILPQDIMEALKSNLTLSVSNVKELKAVVKTATELNLFSAVHVKVNTGMNRLGLDSLSGLENILSYAKTQDRVKVDGVYSHYGCAENQRLLKRATEKFVKFCDLAKRFDKDVTCHISASGGMIKGQFFDMVRIGILLYGYKPFESDKIQVLPIMKVYSPIIKKRKVNKGKLCLYGESKLKRTERILLIRYGYADGLDREKTDELVNNRCMDISAVTDGGANGDYYCVLEDADVQAKKNHTISYEILTKATIRANRIYLK